MEIGGGVLGVVALITWVIAALGGFFMLGVWLRRGAARRGGGATTRLAPPLVFGHFLLAAVGLVVWIVYMFTDAQALSWIALALLVVVAALGFTMFARWIGQRRRPVDAEPTAERHFPVAVVAGHGVFAATTLVLVLLVALAIAGS
ncbi:MAG TPA: hypothetical protein VF053_00325 [Streptosporangiales bacterium]